MKIDIESYYKYRGLATSHLSVGNIYALVSMSRPINDALSAVCSCSDAFIVSYDHPIVMYKDEHDLELIITLNYRQLFHRNKSKYNYYESFFIN